MRKNIFRNVILIALSTSTLISISPSMAASALIPKPKVPKPVCRIELDNAHYSTTFIKHLKQKHVKVNAWSVCNVHQLRVTLTLEIYKTGFFEDHLVKKVETKEYLPTSTGLRVEIKNASVKCKNNKPTSYYGVVYSKAFIGGKWQYAGRTRSLSIAHLECGT
ncbi:MAG: hypothetical protein WDO06_01950 [Actinomycetota bacterium]